MKRLVCLALGLLALTACNNSYERFYSDESAASASWVLSNATEPLKVYQASGNWEKDQLRMFEQGYARIGSANFTGRLENEDALREQAQKVGADAVIVSSDYQGSTTSSLPITTTTPVTTYQSGSASAYGSGGSAYGTYSGTSTTYVPTTTYVPITTHRYEQGALFFRKMKPSCFGALIGRVDNETRRTMGRNQGTLITAVRDGSPAYNANLFAGDVLLFMAGKAVTENSFYNPKTGEVVEVTLWRDGQTLTKTVTAGTCAGL